MNLRYRLLIAKVGPLHRLLRWWMYNSGIFFYKRIYKERNYAELFASLKDSKKGKRCFIIGNGPSLKAEDLNRLVNEDTFGVNEIHRIFSTTKWRPTYFLILDRYSKSTPEEIRDIECNTVFLGDYYWKYNKVLREDAICLHQHIGLSEDKYRFSEDISKCIVNSPTVSYGAMQVAAFLGYSEIYLLGFDHSYSFEFTKDGKVIQTGETTTHFFKDQNSKDIIGNVWGMTKAYEAFKQYADVNGIIVKNATRGGKLKIFERVDFDSLFDS